MAKGFALELADQRLHDFAEAFDFTRHGPATTSRPAAREETVERYIRLRTEEACGQQDEGARLALVFERRAPRAGTIYGLMADKDLYTVVRVALGLPEARSGEESDKQAAVMASQISISDLQDRGKLADLVQRFATRWRGVARPSSATTAVSPGAMQKVIGGDVLMSVQALKTGNQ